MHPRSIKTYLAFFLLIFIVEAVSSAVTFPAVEGWYHTLRQPAWSPPDWLFGPVWTALYIMIALSGARIWNRLPGTFREKLLHPAMATYWVQLMANFLWSLIFFGQKLIIIAFADILLLDAAVLLTILHFRRIDRPAAHLLIPYLLWILFATTLNGGILYLN